MEIALSARSVRRRLLYITGQGLLGSRSVACHEAEACIVNDHTQGRPNEARRAASESTDMFHVVEAAFEMSWTSPNASSDKPSYASAAAERRPTGQMSEWPAAEGNNMSFISLSGNLACSQRYRIYRIQRTPRADHTKCSAPAMHNAAPYVGCPGYWTWAVKMNDAPTLPAPQGETEWAGGTDSRRACFPRRNCYQKNSERSRGPVRHDRVSLEVSAFLEDGLEVISLPE